MKDALQQLFPTSDIQRLLLHLFAVVLMTCLFVGLVAEWYFLALLPAALLLGFLIVVDFKKVFYILLGCLPLSTEVYLPNGFGTDLPTEPLTVGLMGVFLLYLIRHAPRIDGAFFRHPISALLLLHIGWLTVTTITSSMLLVSLKFLLAKIWYITVFYFLAGYLLRTEKDIRKAFWWIFVPLLFTILVILTRHSTYNFSFEDVYQVLSPFYRNHVAYACIMAAFFPFLVLAVSWQQKYSKRWWVLVAILPLFFVAIYLSYTRAAYVALAIALFTYFAIQFRLMKYLLAIATALVLLALTYMSSQNRYLDYAPNYERTITHTDFNNLLEATYKMEDISTMERVYRWVAGFFMVKEEPVFGFGPGNFYNFYKSYTVTSFQTYVSDNPDKSGIHNYYLMTSVEQGIPGLLIFVFILFFALLKGETIYHETDLQPLKDIAMMAILTIIIIASTLIINDLIETDKVGPFFFISLALLVNTDVGNRRKRLSPKQNPSRL